MKTLTHFDSAGKCCFAALADRGGLGPHGNGIYILNVIYLGLLWLDFHDACCQDAAALFADITARLQNHA